MDDLQLLRYSRQIMLPYIDYEGQQKLIDSRVLIIGLGGLGSPVAMYLASAGIGHLVLCDDDQVDLSNLQRQIIHSTDDIGSDKVQSAKESLLKINPDIKITCFNHRLTNDELSKQVALASAIVDASDNFTTRFLINKISVKNQTPLISGAAIKTEGQVSVFNQSPNSPCYHCLYQDTGKEMDTTCSSNGILAPVVGIIGSVQALETLKVIAQFGETLDGRVQLLDAFSMEWQQMKLKKDPHCPVCSQV
jgi:adenylyltransferase/sulfurtransferase